jgi:hypothetical protein
MIDRVVIIVVAHGKGERFSNDGERKERDIVLRGSYSPLMNVLSQLDD